MARDISGAIVNTNEDAYIAFKSKRDNVNKEKEELATITWRIKFFIELFPPQGFAILVRIPCLLHQ
jgi:hypothetical protein